MTLDLLIIGLAISLDPLPLSSLFVLLPSKRGVVKGAAFSLGWLVSLVIVVAITVSATGNESPKSNTRSLAGCLGSQGGHRRSPGGDRHPPMATHEAA
jgi:hypothetical protein